jgi:RNA-directed DNA polymerase
MSLAKGANAGRRVTLPMNIELTRSPDEIRTLFGAMSAREDVADLLEVSYATLVYHIFRSSPARKYKEFEVRKRSGGVRIIRAPQTHLKILQQKLNFALSCVYEPKRCAHGFVKGRSTVSNARPHTNAMWVLNVDIVDFFPSINLGRVRGAFMKAPFNLPPPVATILARIACEFNQLPQGAPSSPMIANIVAAKLDSNVKLLAARNKCSYTRYADDLTFSTYQRDFPEDLAGFVSVGDIVKVGVGAQLQEIITQNGFHVHVDKVALRSRAERQEVTGVVVNTKLNVPRQYLRNVRAILHAWRKFGYSLAHATFTAEYAKRGRLGGLPSARLVDHVHGKLAYLSMVRGKADPLMLRLRADFQHLRARDGV